VPAVNDSTDNHSADGIDDQDGCVTFGDYCLRVFATLKPCRRVGPLPSRQLYFRLLRKVTRTIKRQLPIAIYYEHPEWFRPLFSELDSRGIQYVKLNPSCRSFNPSVLDANFSLLFNRMSASAHVRGNSQAIRHYGASRWGDTNPTGNTVARGRRLRSSLMVKDFGNKNRPELVSKDVEQTCQATQTYITFLRITSTTGLNPQRR
jgi:hypothetical protein